MVFHRLRDKHTLHSLKGFSLIELLVVTGIFIVITGIILASNSRFGGQVVLENMAYDIALSIRHAQLYGIAVRGFGASDFNVAYGMHFDCNNSLPCAATDYQLFADSLQGNGIYDCPNQSLCELVENTILAGGYRINDLCVRSTGSSVYTCGKERLDILFKRPEPDAYISANDDGVDYEAAQIVLMSPRNQTKRVTVEMSGQIAVE